MSHIQYVVDRLDWLYRNRQLVGGLKFYSEPPVLRFFTGRLNPLDNWGSRLADAFAAEFGENF
jgi:tryptophanase